MVLRIFLLIFLSDSFIHADNNMDKLAGEIFSETLSPFCPGRALQDCPSEAASKLKVDIKAKLAAGNSKQQILESLYQQYGEQINANPRFDGIGILAWILPVIFLLLGLVVIYRIKISSG